MNDQESAADAADEDSADDLFPLRGDGRDQWGAAGTGTFGHARGGDAAGRLCFPGVLGLRHFPVVPDHGESDVVLSDQLAFDGAGERLLLVSGVSEVTGAGWTYPLESAGGPRSGRHSADADAEQRKRSEIIMNGSRPVRADPLAGRWLPEAYVA